VEQIEKKGANIKSLKESWLDTTTPQGKLMFNFMAGSSIIYLKVNSDS